MIPDPAPRLGTGCRKKFVSTLSVTTETTAGLTLLTSPAIEGSPIGETPGTPGGAGGTTGIGAVLGSGAGEGVVPTPAGAGATGEGAGVPSPPLGVHPTRNESNPKPSRRAGKKPRFTTLFVRVLNISRLFRHF